ncbi:MAG: TonB-dependent receptor plug domain-containing protein [Chitinophagaceae bacterium]|nr:TonB-dependent receptor plug domain-containing protein [Chitinophagaceae bacterium]
MNKLIISYVASILFSIQCISAQNQSFGNAVDALSRKPLEKDFDTAVANLKAVSVINSRYITTGGTLSKIDLLLNPVKNSQELMRLVPGLFVSQHAGGGKAEQIFLRGFDADHGTDVQIAVDGMPVNMVSHAHGQGYADAHFIIPETVATVDYGLGSYYADKGNLNTAGYISFNTANTLPTNKVQVELGTYNTNRALLLLNLFKNNSKSGGYIAGESYHTNGATENPQNLRRYNLFGKYQYRFNEVHKITVTISAFDSKWNASGQIPERAVASGIIGRFGSIDPTEGGNTARYNLQVKWKYNVNPTTSLETQTYYTRYRFNLFSNFTFFLRDSIHGDEIEQSEQRNIVGIQTALHQKKQIANLYYESMYGIGGRYDFIQDSRLSSVAQRNFISDITKGDIQEANTFAYFSQQLSKGKWLLNVGARVDHFQFAYTDNLMSNTPKEKVSSTIFSPKLILQYTPNKHLQFFVKSGKGFHSNDTRVVIANKGQKILPPSYGSDIGLTYQNKGLLVTISAWHLLLQQEFVYVGDEGIVEPSGKSVRTGIDINLKYQFSNSFFTTMNWNAARPRAVEEQKGNDYIPLAPLMSSNGGVFYKGKKGVSAGVTYRYLASRPANENYTITAKKYLVLDANIIYTRGKYEFACIIENLSNTKWNEAQFATESRLRNESTAVTELHFTPGIPFFIRTKLAVNF